MSSATVKVKLPLAVELEVVAVKAENMMDMDEASKDAPIPLVADWKASSSEYSF
jgi:hypothetical protein